MIVVGLDEVVAAFKKGVEDSPNTDCYSGRLVTHEALLCDLYCNVLGVVVDIFETQFGYDPILVRRLPIEDEEPVDLAEIIPEQ